MISLLVRILPLFTFGLLFWLVSVGICSLCLCPLSFRAFWYAGAALLKSSWVLEMLTSLLLIPRGICLITLAGWLEST